MDHTGQPNSQPNGFVERNYEFSSNFDRVHASQDADDGMSGETVPVEEAEAMDSSAAYADIDVEAAVRIVDGIGSFGAIEFSALTAKDVLTTEFTSLQAAYDYYSHPCLPAPIHFLRHTLILSHGHIEVEATYTRFSDRRDGSFGVIFGGWAHFASLCKFEPEGVGIFEVMSTEVVTILQVRWSNKAARS